MFTIDQLGMLPKLQDPRQVTIELPIVVGDDAPEHVLDMVGEDHPEWMMWVVERVEGVAHELGPGGTFVVLRGSGPQRGTIRFSSRGTQWSDLPLGFIETTPEEAWVRPLLPVR